ncbi:MAG: 4Fe-4S dicluster domain-containing protein [Phycisphaerae bacterium]|nr:4Fe-4S dicluster domain-containing protein [Phycisphaerae bacterium]
MSIKKLTKQDLTKLIDALLAGQKVIAPVAKGDRFDFAPLESADQIRLDYDVTLQPPKKCFQPTWETLLTFEVAGESKAVIDNEKFVLFGIHPYDLVALSQMDKIWSQDNCDVHYLTRRKNATIVAIDVVTPSKDGFASTMGTATVKDGFDCLLTDIGDGFVAQAATEKGEALLKKAAGAKDATAQDLQKRQQVWDKNKKGLNKHELKCGPEYLPKLLDRAYDHPVFAEKAETCFSCGSCTQVCPTCYCFNVQDDVNWDMKTGERQRAWDGCLLDGFTKVAGDHEFRKSREARFRHRIYRKGKYVPTKIGGQIACVGCGRCVSACLPDIANPVNIYNRLVEDLGIE